MGEEKGKTREKMKRGLGVEKIIKTTSTSSRRDNKQGLLIKKVAQYLASDSYMYAPLVSHLGPPSNIMPKITHTSSTSTVRKDVHLVKLQKLFD